MSESKLERKYSSIRKKVAFCTGPEGSKSDTSSLYVRDLNAEGSNLVKLDVKGAAIPRWRVLDNGDVIKTNTIEDIRYLAEGAATAGSILEKAGVDPKTIGSTVYRGAHPGGTAPIGKTVDSNLETEIEGLFVSDASVLPISPGKPPILTILALSKRLADYLKNRK